MAKSEISPSLIAGMGDAGLALATLPCPVAAVLDKGESEGDEAGAPC